MVAPRLLLSPSASRYHLSNRPTRPPYHPTQFHCRSILSSYGILLPSYGISSTDVLYGATRSWGSRTAHFLSLRAKLRGLQTVHEGTQLIEYVVPDREPESIPILLDRNPKSVLLSLLSNASPIPYCAVRTIGYTYQVRGVCCYAEFGTAWGMLLRRGTGVGYAARHRPDM
eukprot:466091-Rhodomonas_salina.3